MRWKDLKKHSELYNQKVEYSVTAMYFAVSMYGNSGNEKLLKINPFVVGPCIFLDFRSVSVA